MKKILVGLLATIQALGPLAYAQTAPPSQAEILKLQNMGKGMANLATSTSPVFNEDGSLVRSDASTATTTQTSQQSIVAKGDYLKTVTGVTGYETTANPGLGSSGGATLSATQSADFSCATELGRSKVIGSQLVLLNSCAGSISAISSVSVSICSAYSIGGSCDKKLHPEAFVDYSGAVGAWTSVKNGNLGVGCTASGVCKLTLQTKTAAGGDGNTMQQKATAQVALQSGNSLNSDISTTLAATTDSQNAIAKGAQTCLVENRERLAQGLQPLTCDGAKEVGVVDSSVATPAGSSSSAESCSADTKTCLREATENVSYTRSCTRTFGLTEYSIPWSVPTKECKITKTLIPATSGTAASSTVTNSCSDADLTGGIKVGSTENSCDASGNCSRESWTDSYVFPEKATAGQGTVYPTAMQGSPATACANHGNGSLAGCADGGWFGRTLSDSECYVTSATTASDGSSISSTSALTYAEKPGCGYCAQPIYTDSCYAQPSASAPADSCDAMPVGCELTASTPVSSIGGLTTAQTETYTCTKQETSCVQYQTNAGCSVNLAQGLDSPPPTLSNTADFNNAMASVALLSAIDKSASNSDPYTQPRIFDGDELRCRQPTGYLSGLLINDCCKISLERTGGSRPMHKCSVDEVKLASARRANQTTFIGDYCSKEVGFWKAKKCVERTQTYCSFDGVLSRIVQNQGRQQLADLVNSGFGATETKEVNFSYYSEKGGWLTSARSNGVTLATWQYPNYCASSKSAADALSKDPNALACPNVLIQWFAVCDLESCGDLPFVPELGSDKWKIQQVDPLRAHTESLSHTSTISGACDTATSQCTYKFSSWPPASGGRASLTNKWVFHLFDTSAETVNVFSLGDTLFKPHSIQGAATTAMPSSIALEYSLDYGRNWNTVALPTSTPAEGVTVPGTDTVISGDCNLAGNSCEYRATGIVTAKLKPWGNAHAPDCTGFTPGELGLLDFSKLDLSEWLASVMDQIKAPSDSTLGKLAAEQASTFYNNMAQGGTQTTSAPVALRVASVSPSEGMGPFNVQLVTTTNWPGADGTLVDDPISSVEIDWGDCTLSSRADYSSQIIEGKVAAAFVARHTYVAPDKLACDAVEKSVAHKVKITLQAKSGVHYTELQVTNQWRNLNGQTVGVGDAPSGAVQPSVTTQLPSGPTTK